MRAFSRNARLVLLYSTITGIAFGVFRFLFNFYILSLGRYDEVFIGTLQTFSALSAILMALPAAYLAERFPQKRIMIATGLLSGFAFLGMVLFPVPFALIAFRMLAGISMSVRQVAIAPFLMSNTGDDERQWVFSFNFGMLTTAQFVGDLLGGLLPGLLGGLFDAAPTDTLSYQLALGSMMLVTILSISPLAFIREAAQGSIHKVDLPFKQVKAHFGLLWRFILPQLIIGLGAGLMQPFMNIYFRHVYDQPDAIIAVTFATGSVGMAIAQFLGPPLADRYGKIKTVILTQVVSVPFLLTLGIGAWVVSSERGGAWLWFLIASVAFVFRLALMNLSNPVYQTFVLEQVPDNLQALAMSLNNLTFQFGWFVMPQVSGWLQVRYGDFGFVPIFFSVAGFYLLAMGVEWFLFMRRPRTQESPSLAGSAAD
jgi:MFS family permease